MIIEKQINFWKLQQEIALVYPDIEGISSIGNEYTFHGLNGNEDLTGIINTHNPIDVIENEAIKYKKRQEDGINAINDLMAELRLNAIANNYPRIINKTIEESFKKVTDNILLGWWISAKEECDLVPVGGYVSQELWDRIYNTINDYISVSYN